MEKKNIVKAILGGAAVIVGGAAIVKSLFGKKETENNVALDSEVEACEEVYDEE